MNGQSFGKKHRRGANFLSKKVNKLTRLIPDNMHNGCSIGRESRITINLRKSAGGEDQEEGIGAWGKEDSCRGWL